MAEQAAGPGGGGRGGRRRGPVHPALGGAGGAAAVDLAVFAQRAVWRAYAPDEYRERVHGCRRCPRDLVVVGGSPVAEGIEPAALVGLPWRGEPLERVYNLGLCGATTSEVWH